MIGVAAHNQTIHLYDHDIVERHNLSNQSLYTCADIGQFKSLAAARSIISRNKNNQGREDKEDKNNNNSSTQSNNYNNPIVLNHNRKAPSTWSHERLKNLTGICSGVDNLATRYQINGMVIDIGIEQVCLIPSINNREFVCLWTCLR